MGEAFDPELHEAVQQMPDEDPPGTVTNELQRGYRRGDRLVRPAVVVVSSGPAEEPATATPEQDQATPAGDAASNPTEDK